MSDIRLALVFKDFAAWTRRSCVGLNIASYATAAVLGQHGVDVSVFPVRNNVDVVLAIDDYNSKHTRPLTHVVISAPWISVYDMRALLSSFKDIKFVVLSHSNVGFLQADPQGVELLREYLKLSKEYPNLQVGGNSKRFVRWLRGAYESGGILLPNLYPLDSQFNKYTRYPWDHSPIKIGAFGAIRPEKNFMTSAAAAVIMRRKLGPVELHMSAGGEGDQGRTVPAIQQMVEDIPGFKLIRHDWVFWDDFIKLVSEMDILLQVSYTESFNMITADGISVDVPSVVSSSIYWAPEEWKADPDNAVQVADTGIKILNSVYYRSLGRRALMEHNECSLKNWFEFLET